MTTTFHSHGVPSLQPVIAALNGLSRRHFMRAAAALAVAPGAAGWATSATAATDTTKASLPAGVRFMNADEAALFQRVAEVTLPVDGSTLQPWSREGLLQTLDAALLATMEPHILQGLKGGLQYFNEGPKSDLGARFVDLTDAQAIAFCDRWSDSNEPAQRGLTMGLKKLVQLSYWANPATWPAIGYDGPMSRRLGLPMQGNAPLPNRS